MHITRIVRIIDSSSTEMIYSLNGCRVWLKSRQNVVHVGKFVSGGFRDYMDDTIDSELCKLAEAIGLSDSGHIKINPNNAAIQTFLKVTKCLP